MYLAHVPCTLPMAEAPCSISGMGTHILPEQHHRRACLQSCFWLPPGWTSGLCCRHFTFHMDLSGMRCRSSPALSLVLSPAASNWMDRLLPVEGPKIWSIILLGMLLMGSCFQQANERCPPHCWGLCQQWGAGVPEIKQEQAVDLHQNVPFLDHGSSQVRYRQWEQIFVQQVKHKRNTNK